MRNTILRANYRGRMQVKFWGVRGSTPTPQAENLRYGGNTSCVEVRINDQIYIFDCGTGFRVLGRELEREFGERPFAAHVFVSHFHWDHIQGIPFFRPLYDSPQRPVLFSFLQARKPNLEQVMAEQMESPYFPVNVDQMRARRQFCNIENGCLDMEDGCESRPHGSIIRKAASDFGWRRKMACSSTPPTTSPGDREFRQGRSEISRRR